MRGDDDADDDDGNLVMIFLFFSEVVFVWLVARCQI